MGLSTIRLKTELGILFFVLFLSVVNSQVAPQITVVGNQNYCAEDAMAIVTDISISNNIGDLDAVYVQISAGYSQGEDVLFLDGVHPNISATWSVGEGQLSLNGPASSVEFENAIRAIQFQTTQSVFVQDRFFSINLGEANFLPSTGHYYFYVSDLSITWSAAKIAAEQQTYFGLQGYLATITSQDEMQLTGEQSTGTGWIGGSDQQNEGTWIWETGPEAGQVFWQGAANGSAPNGMYEFWNTNEPNDFNGEDYAHITDPSIGILGSWNDLPNTGDADINSPYHPKGYIVEFGGMPGDPDINISASTTIVMPKLEETIFTVCDNDSAEITLNTNVDTALWYATSTSSTVINSGLTNQNLTVGTTTFWVAPLFSGCTTGARIPITVNVNAFPIANDITIVQCEDETNDGISTFYLNNYKDDIIADENGQIETGLNVRFFEDASLQTEIDASSYNNLSNYQVIFASVVNESTNCMSFSEVTLQVNSSNGVSALLEVCDDLESDGFVVFDVTEANEQLLDNSTINATVDYYITLNDALQQTNEIGSAYTNEVPFSQIIFARIGINNNCYSINEVLLKVKELPNVLQYEEVYYCLNSFPETTTLYGGITEDIPNNYAYSWSTGETTINIEVNEIGTYEVLVTKPLGCTNQRTITVLPSSTANIQTIEVTDVSENNTITILDSGDGEYEYALDNENGFYQTSNVFENVSAGIHTVFVKDIKNNCGIVSETISVFGFPKFFTPNGDTKNDTWQIKGFSSEFENTFEIKIFNRYGKLISILNSNNTEWDGTHKGELLPTDDYWFVAKLEDGRTFNGHFTLKR